MRRPDTIRPEMSGASSSPRSLVVVNPASAGGRTERRWPVLRRALTDRGVAFDVHHTSAPEDATGATRAALGGGYDRVIAVGGDGTLNEVVNGFFDPAGEPLNNEAVLGMLPSGTGGDFRRTSGLPTAPAALADIVAANRSRRIDLGRIVYDDPATAPRMFINIADCGVGGEVVARVNRSASKGGGARGTAVFLGISLSELVRFGAHAVHLELDGETVDGEVQSVTVANGRCFGGGMRIAPDAVLDDGQFDVVVVPAMGRLRTLSAVPSLYRGTHVRRPGVIVRRAARVRVESRGQRPLLWDVEGEQVGAAPATLTCLAGAIRFCCP